MRNLVENWIELGSRWREIENCGGPGSGVPGPCAGPKAPRVSVPRAKASAKTAAPKTKTPVVKTPAKTAQAKAQVKKPPEKAPAKKAEEKKDTAAESKQKVLDHLKKTGADIKHFSSDDLVDEVGISKADAVKVLADLKGPKGPQSETTAKVVEKMRGEREAEKAAQEKEEKGAHNHTSASIKAVVGSVKTEDGAARRISKLMDKVAKDAGTVQQHGMSKPQAMKTITVNGLKVLWTANHPESQLNAARLIHNLVSKAVPKPLLDSTKSVVVTDQRSSHDAHWEKTYGMSGFRAAATGGDGHAVFYNGGMKTGGLGAFAHEAAHNLAMKTWGRLAPPPDSAFGKAQAMTKGVTSYGSKHATEDFAETVRLATGTEHERNFLQKEHPAKWAAVKPLLHLNSAEWISMATSRTVKGKTPNGGVSSTIFFQDAHGEPADEKAATNAMIVEEDAKGNQIARTYGTLNPGSQNNSPTKNRWIPLS